MAYDIDRYLKKGLRINIFFYRCRVCDRYYSVVKNTEGYSVNCPFCHKDLVVFCR